MRMTGEELYQRRSEDVLRLLAEGPMTNRELSESLHLNYQIVQRVTNRLDHECLIQGHVNHWGLMSNITWSLLKHCPAHEPGDSLTT
jgi:hypothetical protein